MDSSTGIPQRVLIVGASSEIAGALITRWLDQGTTEFALTGRSEEALSNIVNVAVQAGATVSTHILNADDPDGIPPAIEEAWLGGDIDIAVVAIGVLESQLDLETTPGKAWQLMTVNATASIVIGLEIARRLREQRHGTLVLLSSVAGMRGRRDNYVYGASKAALDTFGEGLRQSLAGNGVNVVVARPGFVRSRMSAGIKPAPFSVTTEVSAAAIIQGIAQGKPVIWVPPILAPIFWVLRLLPHSVWRAVVDRVRPS